jgi:hypothetical protein
MKKNGWQFGRTEGGALLWILIVVVIVVGAFFIWKRMTPPPPPPPVIVAATPVPATPPPATPEPVIVKATPTPPPVVVATPPPATPPPLDLAMVGRTPALWPKQVLLVQPATFPLSLNGRVIGEAKAPVGATVRVLRVYNQHVEVEYQNSRQFIPVASTDLMQRALAAFRANGSVLPEAPAITEAPAPAMPAATPPPEAPKVDISVERKRVDTVRADAVQDGMETKASQKFIYNIKVQNRTFGDVPALDVQYVIFVERQKLGTKKDEDTVERVAGNAKTESLSRKVMSQSVSTNEVELWKQSLTGRTFYIKGGRVKVEDGIEGIWVRVLHDGKVIAELTNPSTVTKRGWDAK